MKILVSNDDGIFHPGLWALVDALTVLGEVVVSAPDRNRSGVGTAMTLHDPVRVNEVPSPRAGVQAFAVQGTPGDAVVIGLRELAGGPVDAVIAGINPGNNVTTNVLVSGTLGAAYAGHLNGVPAMAVSVGNGVELPDPTVGKVTAAVAAGLLEHGDGVLINLNFPWAQDWPLKGCRVTAPAPRVLEDRARKDEEAGQAFYWLYRGLIEGADLEALPEECDVAALRHGFVSIGSLAWARKEEHDRDMLKMLAQRAEDAI